MPPGDTHPPGTLTREHSSIWGQAPILSLTSTRVRAAPSCPVPMLLIHDPQGHWGIHPALSPCSLSPQNVLCPIKTSLFPCPLSPQGVPIPVTIPAVSMGCPHPPCSLLPQSVPISLACPHFHGPSPRVFPVPLVCAMIPLTSARLCLPMLSLTPQDVLVPPGCSLGYLLFPWVSLSPGPLSLRGDPLSLWSIAIFPKVFPSPIPCPYPLGCPWAPRVSLSPLGCPLFCPHHKEWFQKTQMGLERSWVSNSRNWRVTGLASAWGVPAPPTPSVPPMCTLMLTTGVLMMGRLGTLRCSGVREPTQCPETHFGATECPGTTQTL